MTMTAPPPLAFPARPSTRITVRLPEGDRRWIDRAAHQAGVSRGAVIRTLVSRQIEAAQQDGG